MRRRTDRPAPGRRIREVARGGLRCVSCGYRAPKGAPPLACPNCRTALWEPEEWRPFTGAATWARLVEERRVAPEASGIPSLAGQIRDRRSRRREDLLPSIEGTPWPAGDRLTLAGTRKAFEETEPFTVGVEEELMLLAPGTYELAPVSDRVLASLPSSGMFQPELRASQVEIVTPVCRTAAEAGQALSDARSTLADATVGIARIAAAGTHPVTSDWGEVTGTDRYRRLEHEYAWATRRSLSCGLHVHVAVGGAERSLAVYNALRSYLPEVAALAANAPFFEGEDTGLCSVRPKLNEMLPRTGVPPAFSRWEDLIAYLDWGRSGGLFPDASFLWWDLRPHPVHGTLEVRVADSQTAVEDAAAVAALLQCLVAWLAGRWSDGEALTVHPTHRIAENTWRALRYGVAGHLVDLTSGVPDPARQRILRLVDALGPTSRRLGCELELAGVRALAAGNGADRQRYVARRDGMDGLLSWLVETTEPGPHRRRADAERPRRP